MVSKRKINLEMDLAWIERDVVVLRKEFSIAFDAYNAAVRDGLPFEIIEKTKKWFDTLSVNISKGIDTYNRRDNEYIQLLRELESCVNVR